MLMGFLEDWVSAELHISKCCENGTTALATAQYVEQSLPSSRSADVCRSVTPFYSERHGCPASVVSVVQSNASSLVRLSPPSGCWPMPAWFSVCPDNSYWPIFFSTKFSILSNL